MLTASAKVKSFSQLQGQELDAIAEREEKLKRSELQFGERFREAKKKIDGLLSSLFSEYESYSGLVNKTSDANGRNLAAASSRNEQMASLMDTAVNQAIDDGKSYHFKAENKEKIARMELADKISDGHVATKSVNKRLDLVEAQTKQFIGERQGAWELHYNNQEIQLRKKADTNKELLQKHQSESQVSFTLVYAKYGVWNQSSWFSGSALSDEDHLQLLGVFAWESPTQWQQEDRRASVRPSEPVQGVQLIQWAALLRAARPRLRHRKLPVQRGGQRPGQRQEIKDIQFLQLRTC